MKLPLAMVALCIAALPAAQASPVLFFSALTPEAAGATGSGTVELKYDSATHTLSIDTDFSGLSGGTTVAHIHCCVAAPGTVGVAVTPGTLPGFPVGVSAESYSVELDLENPATYTAGFLINFGEGTAAGGEAALIAGLTDSRAYFNVHTTSFPAGEIRGFLAQVPEPPSYAMLGLGLLTMGAAARRRRRGSGTCATSRCSQ
jgi:CHRD domain/PEP-CTERM motif